MSKTLEADIRLAIQSVHAPTLARNAEHHNHLVRARVAGNAHIDEDTHLKLLTDPRAGVVLWALGNKRTTREHFVLVYERSIKTVYCPIVCPALAGSAFATPAELEVLLGFKTWAVGLAVVNNHACTHKTGFLQLISTLLPPQDKEEQAWDEVEKRAYSLTYGTSSETDL